MPIRNYSSAGRGNLHISTTEILIRLATSGDVTIIYEEQPAVTLNTDDIVYTKERAVKRTIPTVLAAKIGATLPRVTNLKTGAASGVTSVEDMLKHVISVVRADQNRIDTEVPADPAPWLAPPATP